MSYDYLGNYHFGNLIYRRYHFKCGPAPSLIYREDERTLTPQGVLRTQPRHQRNWARESQAQICPWSWNEMVEIRKKSSSMFTTIDLLANTSLWGAFVGAATIYEQYLALLTSTNNYIARVGELARSGFDRLYAGGLLVDFTISVLREDRGGLFERLLNSQRIRIYGILDEALLEICFDEWEDEDRTATPWDEAIKPLAKALSKAIEFLPTWAKADRLDIARYKGYCNQHLSDNGAWMEEIYFNRTRKMLEESLQIFWVKYKIQACVQQRLPEELVEVIVQDVLAYEALPIGRLRTRYFPKGKDKL